MIFLKSEDSPTDSPDVVSEEEAMTESQITLNSFWPSITDEVKRIKQVDGRNQVLPLARIKKIMKLDDDVKMISAEAPLLFAKACEIFIHELTLRAWVHTEDNKRRTLQRNDIAMAITKYDQFDFLIDIVPREEVKQVKKEPETKSSVISDQVQYYLQLAQQHQQALQQGSVTTAGPSSTINQLVTPSIITATTSTGNGCLGGTPTIQVHGQTLSAGPSTLTLAPSQNYLVTNSVGQQATVIGNLQPQQQQQQQQQPIQLVQQIVSQNGEITHVPINISQNQLNLIRMQIQNQTSQPPIIIQTSPMQQPTQILHVAQNPTTGNVYLNTTPTQHNQAEE